MDPFEILVVGAMVATVFVLPLLLIWAIIDKVRNRK